MRPRALLLSLLAFGSATAARAQADADATPGITTYNADFFSDAAPSTAYDMLRRLPGFSLVEADADVRGYAAAQGNVLVDGARPASKRESIEDLLRRIPAQAVVRIELIRDGAVGFDLLGQAVLANVVRRKVDAERTGAAEAGAHLVAGDGMEPVFKGEYARTRGDRALELSFGTEPELDDKSGDGRIVERAADGTLLERGDLDTHHLLRVTQGTASWRQPWGGGRLRLDAAVRDSRDREGTLERTREPGDAEERSREDETLQELEVGLNYARALGERTRLEVVSSQQLGWLDGLSRSVEDDGDERFEQRTRSGEGIVRADLTHARSARLSLTLGAELARNTLDGDASLFEDGTLVALPGSRVRIEERRGEAAVGAQWQAATNWRVEPGLAFERSEIRQTGDTPLTRQFDTTRPSLALRWQRDSRERWRLSLARIVGQLDFEDFVASAALDTDVVSAGNAALEPEKTWRSTLSWEHDVGRDGALVLTATHDEISDVVDRVPVAADDELFDAPGNIGPGVRDSLLLEFGGSLDRFGLADVRIDAKVVWVRGRVRDPTTGLSRRISEEHPVEGEFGFTHTLAERGLRWGMSVDLAERESEYRFDEIARERSDATLSLFAERNFPGGWRVRAELADIGGSTIEESRERHDGPRAESPIESIEVRRHRVPTQAMITVRREFGD